MCLEHDWYLTFLSEKCWACYTLNWANCVPLCSVLVPNCFQNSCIFVLYAKIWVWNAGKNEGQCIYDSVGVDTEGPLKWGAFKGLLCTNESFNGHFKEGEKCSSSMLPNDISMEDQGHTTEGDFLLLICVPLPIYTVNMPFMNNFGRKQQNNHVLLCHPLRLPPVPGVQLLYSVYLLYSSFFDFPVTMLDAWTALTPTVWLGIHWRVGDGWLVTV